MPSKKKDYDGRGRRELVSFMIREHCIAVRQACRTARLARSAFYAPRPPRDDSGAINAIEGYIERNPQHGFDKVYPAVRRPSLGKCRLYRVYKALRLNIKRRGKRRLPARIKAPLVVPERPNEVWSADFMSDALWSGRRFRTSNVMDDFNRESLKIDRHQPASPAGRASARPAHRDPRQTCHAQARQRPGAHQRRTGQVG
jgi:putative transposase